MGKDKLFKKTLFKKPRAGANALLKRAVAVLALVALLLASGILVLELLQPQEGEEPLITMEEEQAREAGEEPPAEEVAEEDDGILRGVINPGDTAGRLLQEWLSVTDVHSVVSACKDVFALTRLRAGQPYVVMRNATGFSRFEYEIDDDKKLVVCREDSGFIATVERIEYDVRLEKVEGAIDSSLFLSMAKLGETPMLAVKLADIFAWEINFIRDIQPGDSFKVLVEKRFRAGEFSSYGKLLAAEFVNQGSIYEAFAFTGSQGGTTYYNAAGESVRRAFLKAPLSFSRISSGFNLRRKHPVFHDIRAHPAIDYAAPTGTPVKAIGDGQVTFRGWGTGAGNYITLKHFGGYESMYLHLNGFARNLKKGDNVRQGQVIGYVGSTGYSTGPHLDFRMKRGGKFINPTTLLTPRAEPLSKQTLLLFKEKRELYRLYLEGKKALAEYTVEQDKKLQ